MNISFWLSLKLRRYIGKTSCFRLVTRIDIPGLNRSGLQAVKEIFLRNIITICAKISSKTSELYRKQFVPQVISVQFNEKLYQTILFSKRIDVIIKFIYTHHYYSSHRYNKRYYILLFTTFQLRHWFLFTIAAFVCKHSVFTLRTKHSMHSV